MVGGMDIGGEGGKEGAHGSKGIVVGPGGMSGGRVGSRADEGGEETEVSVIDGKQFSSKTTCLEIIIVRVERSKHR